MKNIFKKSAAVVALAFGGFGSVFGGYATVSELTRDRSHEIAGVNLTVPMAAFTVAAGGLFYAGLRGAGVVSRRKDNGHKPQEPRP